VIYVYLDELKAGLGRRKDGAPADSAPEEPAPGRLRPEKKE
jgi:hypothetical protein